MFDVETYLHACLESLVGQHLDDIEMIIVDDGSTDGSRAIAEAWSADDARIRILEQSHQGLSAARNTGVRAATGQYLAFCDSDDVVPLTGYASLVSSLEGTGSDLATGNVRRLDSVGLHPHPGYGDLFDQERPRTHILRLNALVRDRMVWNKVFRRSFWDSEGLVFALPMYEDAPVMIRAHIAASTVDVLSEVVYHWRLREAGTLSITQRRFEPTYVAACMRMVLDTYEVVQTHAVELVPPYADDMCRGDIHNALRMLHLHDAATMSEALVLARAFVTGVPGDLIDILPSVDRQLMIHLRRGEFSQIQKLVGLPV
jgi:CDP-glycerol glycerophosphotransferase